MNDSARILILTGASSSGKTSALRTLSLLTTTPAIVFPADLVSVPEEARSRTLLHEMPHDHRLAIHRSIFRAYYRTLAEFQRNGFHALGETIFKDEHQVEVYSESLKGCRPLLVRLSCSPEVRRSREAGRADRVLGLTDETADQEITDLAVDHEIGTTNLSVSEVADALLAHLEPADR